MLFLLLLMLLYQNLIVKNVLLLFKIKDQLYVEIRIGAM